MINSAEDIKGLCCRPEPVLTRVAIAAFVQWAKASNPAATAACIDDTEVR